MKIVQVETPEQAQLFNSLLANEIIISITEKFTAIYAFSDVICIYPTYKLKDEIDAIMKNPHIKKYFSCPLPALQKYFSFNIENAHNVGLVINNKNPMLVYPYTEAIINAGFLSDDFERSILVLKVIHAYIYQDGMRFKSIAGYDKKRASYLKYLTLFNILLSDGITNKKNILQQANSMYQDSPISAEMALQAFVSSGIFTDKDGFIF